MNDTNNDDISRFPLSRLGLYFHNTINTLRYLTLGPEIGASHGVQKVGCAGQSSDKKTGESYNPPSALNLRVTVKLYAWCVTVCKANRYLPLNYSDKFTRQ